MDVMSCDKPKNAERRGAPRMPYHSPAQYTNASVNGVGTVRDISSDGMFLETCLPLDVGDQIRIAFRFRHSRHPMKIKGKIARNAHSGFGVRFLWP